MPTSETIEKMKHFLELSLVLLAAIVTTTTAQCFGGQNINCGSFCCPPLQTNELFDTRGNRRDQCCSTFSARTGCCSGFENSQQFGTSTCSGQICPNFNGDISEIFDDNRRPRNECCRYFRGGCCTTEENETLELLFQLAIGVSIAVMGLIIVIIILVVCCCFCVCN